MPPTEPPQTAKCPRCQKMVEPIEREYITLGWLNIPDGVDVYYACPICGAEVDFDDLPD